MRRPQVSTNGGVLSLFGGFLNIFNNVKVEDFMDVFQNLTFGDVFTMGLPIITGIWLILHKEHSKS